jgi:hypothetical protein
MTISGISTTKPSGFDLLLEVSSSARQSSDDRGHAERIHDHVPLQALLVDMLNHRILI